MKRYTEEEADIAIIKLIKEAEKQGEITISVKEGIAYLTDNETGRTQSIFDFLNEREKEVRKMKVNNLINKL